MIVRIYDYDDQGNQTFRGEANVFDCFPDNPEESRRARFELEKAGRYWAGGGAAPLVLLTRR